MPIQKLARIRIEPNEFGRRTVYVETQSDYGQWKLRAAWATFEAKGHPWPEYDNDYVHMFIIETITNLINKGYTFIN